MRTCAKIFFCILAYAIADANVNTVAILEDGQDPLELEAAQPTAMELNATAELNETVEPDALSEFDESLTTSEDSPRRLFGRSRSGSSFSRSRSYSGSYLSNPRRRYGSRSRSYYGGGVYYGRRYDGRRRYGSRSRSYSGGGGYYGRSYYARRRYGRGVVYVHSGGGGGGGGLVIFICIFMIIVFLVFNKRRNGGGGGGGGDGGYDSMPAGPPAWIPERPCDDVGVLNAFTDALRDEYTRNSMNAVGRFWESAEGEQATRLGLEAMLNDIEERVKEIQNKQAVITDIRDVWNL